MTKNWTVTEKVIGGFQILWGVLGLIVAIWSTKISIDLSIEHLDLTWDKVSIPKVVKNYHFRFLIPLLTMFAGLTLIINKRMGWLICIVTSFLHGGEVILALRNILALWNIENETTVRTIMIYSLAGLMTIFFLTMFGLLLTRQFRNKYNPTRATWWTIAVLVVLLMADQLLLS